MKPTISVEESYLALFKLLMQSKRQAVELGATYGLTGLQTITVLLLEEPRAMNSFKKVFNCDASNVTGIIDGLEQKHMVSRYESRKDRRVKMVQLEPAGLQTRRELLASMAGSTGSLLKNLDATETETFLQLVQKITAEPSA